MLHKIYNRLCHVLEAWWQHMVSKVMVMAWLLTHWGWHEMDNISQTTFFKWIFLNENVWISLKISVKFVPKVWLNNIPALVPIMAWHRPGWGIKRGRASSGIVLSPIRSRYRSTTSRCSGFLYLQCMTLNIFKPCHLGYLNLKIYSPIKFYHSYVFQWYQENWKVSTMTMWATRF